LLHWQLVRRRLAVLAILTAAPAWPETFLVIPFSNLSKTPSLDWIGVAAAEAVSDAFLQAGLTVVSDDDRREALAAFGDRLPSPLSLASISKFALATGAGRVVHGQFEVSGDAASRASSVRLVVRVLDHGRLRYGPQNEHIGALAEIASIAARAAWQTLAQVAPAAAPAEEDFRKRNPPPRLEALENYARGLMAATPAARHRFFADAARLDPDYAAPRFELGKLQLATKEYRVAAAWLEGVPPGHARRIEAAFLLGVCRHHTGDLAGALAAFEEVAAATAAHEVINNVAALQSQMNRPEALAGFRRALEADPVDPDYQFNVGYSLWRRGEFEAAADSFRAAIDRRPDDQEAILFLGRCLKKSGPRSGDPRSEGRERIKEHTSSAALSTASRR
jgi:tetratricopeptide (TPR) repeat protein